MTDERVILSTDEAFAMLADGPVIHTYRQSPGGLLLGADWSRADVVEAIAVTACELSGPRATARGYGMMFHDDSGELYLQTKPAETFGVRAPIDRETP